nr:long-chain-fatty-acid--CoA ligase [Cyclobacteriaceae bacterium]
MQNFPWQKHYPAGIPNEIGPLEYSSLIELFETAGKKNADKVAFENMGARLTFAQVDQLSTHFAAYL